MQTQNRQKPNRLNFLTGLFLVLLVVCAEVHGQTGNLRVVVAGRTLPPSIQAERRGSQILIPVVPIARELGYSVSVNNSSETIQVRRVGIEAEFSKQTAEVRENGITITGVAVTADIFFPPNPDFLLLPIEIAAPLLNVSISIDSQENLVKIDSRDVSSAITSHPNSKFDVGIFNYNYSTNFNDQNYYQNLNLYSVGRIGNSIYQSNATFLGGSSGKPLLFYGGNFTLTRPGGDEVQIGDLTNTVGSEQTLLNTLVRGFSYSRPLIKDKAVLSFYGGRSFSGITGNIIRNYQTLPFDTTIGGGRFSFTPYQLKQNAQNPRTLTFSVGAVGFNGKDNKGFLTDFASRYNTRKFSFEAELALGNFDIKTFGNRQLKGFGTGLILGATYRPLHFLTLQGRYDRFSPNFSNPTRTNQYSNRETKSIGVTVQALKNLSFGANASISENKNPIFFNGATIESYQTKSYGLNLAYDPVVKFLPRFSLNLTNFHSPLFGNLTLIYANFSREYKNVRPFANYIMSRTNGNTGHGFSFGASIDAEKLGLLQFQQNFFFNSSFTRINDLQCQFASVPCSETLESRFRLSNTGGSVDWNPNRTFYKRINFSIGIGYNKDTEKIGLIFRSAAGIKLPFGQTLGISYFRSNFGNELRFSLAGPLTFWKSKKSLEQISFNSDALLTDSKISGRVYQDENSNRQFDPQIDIPMKDVRIRLNNGVEVISDVNGLYTFEKVPPGDHRIVVNLEDIRANLVPANGLEQKLTVLPRTTVNTNFRLVKSGWLSGRIWHDGNANGIYDEGEGLPDIRVISSTGKDTYSERDGLFLLGELPPGEQTIFIDERYQPENLLTAAQSLKVTIESGQETKNCFFIYKTKPREVKEINFGNKNTKP